MSSKKNFFMAVSAVIMIFLSVASGVFVARMVVSPFKLGDHGDAIEPVPRDGKVNMVIVGIDEVGYNTDVILLVNINPVTKKINMLSIPRDTRVYVGNAYRKINSVYGYAVVTGGKREELLIKTIREVTDVPIHYYAIFNIKTFREIIDVLGGVEYDVPRDFDYNDPLQNLTIHISKGFQVLDGKAAEGIVRYRDDYAMGDLQRIGVQQEFLKELVRQKLKPSYITKLPSIYESVTQNVISNLTLADITKYASAAQKIGSENLNTVMLPGKPQTIQNVSYYIKNDEEIAALVNTDF